MGTPVEGNAFAVVAAVARGLRDAGNDHSVVAAFQAKAMSGDYDHVLAAALAVVTATTTRRAAIYNRVSTREQAEHGHNLQGDIDRCMDRIAREGWQHHGTYEDGGRQVTTSRGRSTSGSSRTWPRAAST